MKTKELISIIKKYMDDDLRLIIRSEIKLAFKELANEKISVKEAVNPQIQKPKTLNEKQNIIKQQSVKKVEKVPIRTGNSTLDDILLETKNAIINEYVLGEAEIDDNSINALMTGNAPVGKTVMMTNNEELDFQNEAELVDKFINMSR